MKEKLIDVLVPCAGSGRYLEATLRSVLAQSHRALRVTVCDNACQHELCAAIVASLGDDRVRVVRFEKRLPPISNWNRCLQRVEAEYFCFVHDDDVWAPDHLSSCLEILTDRPERTCVLSAHANFTDVPDWQLDPAATTWWSSLASLDQDDLLFALAASPIAHMSAAVFRSRRLSFEPDLSWNADQAFFFAHTLAGEAAITLSGRVGIRQHAQNDTKSFSSARQQTAVLALMRRQLVQLAAENRLRSDYIERHLDSCPPGLIFRVMQCAFSWPPHPVLRSLGARLHGDRAVRTKAARHFRYPWVLAHGPAGLWSLASFAADYGYYRKLRRPPAPSR